MKPAPGDLKIVQALVNTAVRRTHTEELSSPRALGLWLLRWRLIGEDPELSTGDLEQAIVLREGVRALLWANNGMALDTQAVLELDRVSATLPLSLRFGAEGEAYVTASEGASALGRWLGLFAAARFADSWPRFKACGDRICGAAFYDVTKNLSGRWCSQRCGNRISARAHRRRRSIGSRRR